MAARLRRGGAIPARRTARGRPPADARRRRHRRVGEEAGRSGSNPQSVKRILAGVLVAACAVVGAWLWVRDSSFVAVRTVTVTGLSSSETPQIRSALRSAALDMTTLHVREDALRAAVAAYPSIKDVQAHADLPHRLAIRVSERAPVAAIDAG